MKRQPDLRLAKSLAVLLVALSVSNCSLFGGTKAENTDQEQARQELGFDSSKPLTETEHLAVDNRIRLKKMESALSSDEERTQYDNYKDALQTDERRIQFLSIPTMDGRDQYASDKGIYAGANRFPSSIRDAIQRSDVVLGMSRDAVEQAWGAPEFKAVAGQRKYGNEKWVYKNYVPSPDGFQEVDRVVFFEGGKVVGWHQE